MSATALAEARLSVPARAGRRCVLPFYINTGMFTGAQTRCALAGVRVRGAPTALRWLVVCVCVCVCACVRACVRARSIPFLFPILEPHYVADKIIQAVRRNEPELMMPRALALGQIIRAFAPVSVYDAIIEVLGARRAGGGALRRAHRADIAARGQASTTAWTTLWGARPPQPLVPPRPRERRPRRCESRRRRTDCEWVHCRETASTL